jgi:putative ABC transport system ATP-binding protein
MNPNLSDISSHAIGSDFEQILWMEGVGMSVEVPDGTIHILKNVSLALSRGQSLAVVGPSGSGKSTLLALAAGLQRPTEGAVFLGGAEVSLMTDSEAAAHRSRWAGFVFQDFRLIRSLCVLDNVLVPAYVRGVKDLAKRALELLEELGLSNHLRAMPETLSGGEQQRVAIARALLLRPPLLFCDEPTGSLDIRTAEVVSAKLFQLVHENGTAMLLATHDPVLARACDKSMGLATARGASPESLGTT